jgi:hypothetical protein
MMKISFSSLPISFKRVFNVSRQSKYATHEIIPSVEKQSGDQKPILNQQNAPKTQKVSSLFDIQLNTFTGTSFEINHVRRLIYDKILFPGTRLVRALSLFDFQIDLFWPLCSHHHDHHQPSFYSGYKNLLNARLLGVKLCVFPNANSLALSLSLAMCASCLLKAESEKQIYKKRMPSSSSTYVCARIIRTRKAAKSSSQREQQQQQRKKRID